MKNVTSVEVLLSGARVGELVSRVSRIMCKRDFC